MAAAGNDLRETGATFNDAQRAADIAAKPGRSTMQSIALAITSARFATRLFKLARRYPVVGGIAIVGVVLVLSSKRMRERVLRHG